MQSRKISKILGPVAGLVAIAAIAGGGWVHHRLTRYVDPGHARIERAGYVERVSRINGLELRYLEGPDHGPPLVLLHAQLLDRFSYNRVMPALARNFHVYAIDYPGHGGTVTPEGYPMTANRIGADLGDFIARDIGQPVFVSGNSSGGLLATWLAANRPALIRAALLEDPPLFSSEYPRIKHTIAYRAFHTSESAISDRPDDFLLYWIDRNARFFRKNVGPGVPTLLSQAVKIYRKAHPGMPAEIGLLGNDTVRMMVRGLDQYDPRFGAAFYDGTWNAGFDHAEALAKIRCPVLLMHAQHAILPDGTLNGAMSQAEAERAALLLRHGQYLAVDVSHVVNLADPDGFVRTAQRFFLKR